MSCFASGAKALSCAVMSSNREIRVRILASQVLFYRMLGHGSLSVEGWHGSLRVTPAMAAGVTDHVWSIDELLKAGL
jgi:hypothetical protein